MNHSSYKESVAIPGFGKISLTVNKSIHRISDLLLMAVRKNNKKRNFLFVSKLLAKHIPTLPKVLFESCHQLAEQYNEQQQLPLDNDGRFICRQKTLVIGFAETATAMGHAVHNCFSGDVQYVHTTRDTVEDSAFAFEFKEEHSHATEQLFYLQKEEWIKEARDIIVVDDEVTTGKTIRNIIEQIEKHYPGKRYHVFTFLDWRNESNREAYKSYCQERQLNIQFHSLISGQIGEIDIKDNTVIDAEIPKPLNYNATDNGWEFHICNHSETLISSARQGIDCDQRDSMHKLANSITQQMSTKLKGNKRSIIGTGEFMYLPMKCAEQLPGINLCNATTRSPIIPNDDENYGVKRALQFAAPHDGNRVEYLYNVNNDQCDEVLVFIESIIPQAQLSSLLMAIDTANYQYKHVVFCKGI